MIDEETLLKWEEWSKRDDAGNLFVPSDLRQMLGEIRELRAGLEKMQALAFELEETLRQLAKREEILITPDGQIHKL